jgi:hypothetical protein
LIRARARRVAENIRHQFADLEIQREILHLETEIELRALPKP